MPCGKSFEEEYTLTPQALGCGMSGPVLLARRRGPWLPGTGGDEFVAVKRLAKGGVPLQTLKRFFKEADTYLKMDHPNIAKLIRVCDDPQYVYLVMEHCSGGSLSDKLSEVGRFDEVSAAGAVSQVLSAVNYCHRHPSGKVCHRDLKHSNILYESDTQGAGLKLIDFGLSCVLSAQQPKACGYAGTLSFSAPEVITLERYDESCDLWSIGVISYSLLCGCLPFEASTEGHLVQKITSGRPQELRRSAWQDVGDTAKDFVQRLLAKDPRQRPTAAEAMQLPWITLNRASMAGTLPKPEVLRSLRDFAYENAVRRAVATFVLFAQGTPATGETALLEEQFRALDKDSDGTISIAELVQALQKGLVMAEREARWIFQQLAVAGDARIHHSEFMAAVTGTQVLCNARAVHAAFSHFDENKDGKIELPELELVLGKQFCGQPTRDIFQQCDTNGDMTIDIDEFLAVLAVGADAPSGARGMSESLAKVDSRHRSLAGHRRTSMQQCRSSRRHRGTFVVCNSSEVA